MYSGAKVREIATGDIGTVLNLYDENHRSWWVLWESGLYAGDKLHISERNIELIPNNAGSPSIAECIKILIDAGYSVTKA